MYKRPTPLKPGVALSPTIHPTQTTNWSRWMMEPITSPTPPDSEEPATTEIDLEAKRLQEQEDALRQLKEQIQKEAYAEGYARGLLEGHAQGVETGNAEGYSAGMARANEKQEQAAIALMALADATHHEIAALHEEIGQSLVQMGARIARHILSVELREPHNSVASIVRTILKQHDNTQSLVTFYLHEQDLAAVQSHVQNAPHHEGVRFVASPELKRGDVNVRTAYGDIDATLETRWNDAMAAIGLNLPSPSPVSNA